ncbi:MAG: hypothetical protein KKD63_12735 [Proteobacteria bacterium]|nr:hypothetical protein [Desulfobulbaceae bacterium]MBU4153735.1 hypothetical protein [Pseudomonadota bacterium]
MTDKKKTEVNLEMCSGFFRIPTDDIIYNITVLASNEPSTTKVVEKIIEVEKIVEVEKFVEIEKPSSPTLTPPVSPAPPAADDYFERCSQKFLQEISLLDKEVTSRTHSTSTSQEGTIRDLADMANELKNVLQTLKATTSQPGRTTNHSVPTLTPALERLSEKISQATNLCPPAAQTSSPPTTKTITRYLFNLDTVFQTIYELCTNETVKSHIQNSRAKAEEIFDKNAFYNAISPKVSTYTEDDGFLTVPMTDIYTALGSACSEKTTCNLLAKMDQQQASIFLDQFLPLEIPPKEEMTTIDEDNSESAPPANTPSDSMASLLDECHTAIDKLIYQSVEQTDYGPDMSDDLTTHIENAMVIAASIQHDANRLRDATEVASSGQYNPFEQKIKGLKTLAETMLSKKTQEPQLSYEESLAAGESAAKRVLTEISARIQSQSPPTPSPPTQTAPAAKTEETVPAGEASQDDIDRLLAELG